jgi:sec-independent protein translocase protein TatA
MVGLDNPIHLLFLLVIVLLIFGAKRLPEMGRSLGSGLRGFKESVSGESAQEVGEEHVAKPAPALTEAVHSPRAAHEGEHASVADQLETRTTA